MDDRLKHFELAKEEFNEGALDCQCCALKCCALKCVSGPLVCTCDCYNINNTKTFDDVLLKDETEEEKRREHLYKTWSINGCQLYFGKSLQKVLEKHLGPNLTNYFTVLKYTFIWVTIMFIVGVFVTAASFYTTNGVVNPATPICKANYTDYYMCPLCDNHCPFWYLKQAIVGTNLCTRHFRLIFDNPIIWIYSIFIIAGAVVLNLVVIYKYKILKSNDKNMSDYESNVDQNLCGTCSSRIETCQNKDNKCVTCCCSIGCSAAVQYIWALFSTVIFGGIFWLFMILTLYAEIEMRKHLINKHNVSTFVLFFCPTLLLAIVQYGFNAVVKILNQLLHNLCYCKKDNSECCSCMNAATNDFIVLLIPKMILSYLPVIYRIIFYGNIVSNPDNGGYTHIIGTLRFQHCPSYGCMDVGLYVFLGIIAYACKPSYYILQKTCNMRLICHTIGYNSSGDHGSGDHGSGDHASGDHGSGDHGSGDHGNGTHGSDNNDENIRSCCKKDYNNQDQISDDYADLIIIYGFTIFFITAAGAAPLLAAIIVLPIIARHKSNYYVHWNNTKLEQKKAKERKSKLVFHSSMIIFVIITLISGFSNLGIVILNSRVVQHISYGKNNDIQLNFKNYLDEVLPAHNLTTIAEGGFFPNYEANSLPMLYRNGEEVRADNGEVILYLPFINFECLRDFDNKVGQSFTKTQFVHFISKHGLNNNRIINYMGNQTVQQCFNDTVTCKSRGFSQNSRHSQNYKKTRELFLICLIAPSLTVVVVILVGCLTYNCPKKKTTATTV